MYKVIAFSLVVPLLISGCAETQSVPNETKSVHSSSPKQITSSSTRKSTPTPTLATINPEQSLAPIDGTQGEGNSPRRAKVDWSQLPEGLQAVIDADTAAANCKSLDARFSDFPSNSQLAKYLTEAVALAGCQ